MEVGGVDFNLARLDKDVRKLQMDTRKKKKLFVSFNQRKIKAIFWFMGLLKTRTSNYCVLGNFNNLP
jgi:hypothetical protein